MTLPTTANVTAPEKKGYRWRINDTYYRDALGMGEGRLEQGIAQFSVPIEDSPEEVRGKDQPEKTHAQMDFSSGDNLLYAYAPGNDDWDAKRFWRSVGIEQLDEGDRGFLLRPTYEFESVAELITGHGVPDYSNGVVALLPQTGGFKVFAAWGVNVYRVSNADGSGHATAILDPWDTKTAYNITSIATDGYDIYYATDGGGILVNGASSGSPAGGFTVYSTQSADRIWWLKGRIIAARGSTLYEIPSSGTARAILTLPSNVEVQCAADAGAAIVAGASNGTLYSFTGDKGELTLAAEASVGSDVTGVASKSGTLMIGTKRGSTSRLYYGAIGGDLTPKNLQLLREWSNATKGPSNLVVADDQLYFLVSFSGDDAFTWALDLATLGLWDLGPTGDRWWPGGLGVVGDDQLYTLTRTSTSELRLTWQPDNKWRGLNDGRYPHLVTPLVDLFDAREKVWTTLEVFGNESPDNPSTLNGAYLVVHYTTDPDDLDKDPAAADTNWVQVSWADPPGKHSINAKGRWIAFIFEWKTETTTVAPFELQGFSVSAYPGPGDTRQQIVLNASDRVERRGKKPLHIPGFGREIYESLEQLEGTSVELEDLHLGRTWIGTIERVSYPVQSESLESPTTAAVVTFRGRVA